MSKKKAKTTKAYTGNGGRAPRSGGSQDRGERSSPQRGGHFADNHSCHTIRQHFGHECMAPGVVAVKTDVDLVYSHLWTNPRFSTMPVVAQIPRLVGSFVS
jgi:hypothetical protein